MTQQFWLQDQVTKSLTSISLRLRNAVIVYFRMIQLLSLKTFHSFVFPPSLFVLLNQWTWTERVYIELEIIVIELNNAGYWNSFYKGVLLSITEVTPGKTRNNIIQFYIMSQRKLGGLIQFNFITSCLKCILSISLRFVYFPSHT